MLGCQRLFFGQEHNADTDLCTTMRAEGGGIDYRRRRGGDFKIAKRKKLCPFSARRTILPTAAPSFSP